MVQITSGKSNLLLSMSLLDKLVHLSARSSSTTKLPYDPFLLRKGWDKNQPNLKLPLLLMKKNTDTALNSIKTQSFPNGYTKINWKRS